LGFFGICLAKGGGEVGKPAAWSEMEHGPTPVPVAEDFRTRLRGLAWRERELAGPGLLFPRCASVHTFGMRFELDVYFLDRDGEILSVRLRVPPNRVLWCRGARKVLEIPSRRGERQKAAGP
jgi:uncharacterized membrane protein (UPF0127 family)